MKLLNQIAQYGIKTIKSIVFLILWGAVGLFGACSLDILFLIFKEGLRHVYPFCLNFSIFVMLLRQQNKGVCILTKISKFLENK